MYTCYVLQVHCNSVFKVTKTILGGESQENKEKDNISTKSESDWQAAGNSSESGSSSNLQYSLTISEGRSLPNILKRISNLVALKNVVSNYDLKCTVKSFFLLVIIFKNF